MKALTQKKTASVQSRAKQPDKPTVKVSKPEAQCCAKTSRTVAGCHD